MESYFRVSDPVGRLESLGLPRYLAKAFWAEVDKWEQNSGPAWTVQRLKSLKVDLFRQASGHPPLTWVRKNRKGGWYGAIGGLFRYAQKSAKTWKATLGALMCYSGFIPDAPTEEHVKKFRASVEAAPVWIPPNMKSTLRRVASERLGHLTPGSPVRLITYQGHPSVKSPIYGERSVPQDEALEREILWITQGKRFAMFSDPHSMFLNRHYDCYGPVLEGLDAWLAHSGFGLPGLSGSCFSEETMEGPFVTVNRRFRHRPDQDVLAGKVVPLTKDGGWKVRWIASPYRLHQAALAPLGKALFKSLRTLPWDCTHDQEKAIPIIQQFLKSGKTCFAVDLSSATDYFPLDLQLEVLGELFPGSPLVELFGELSRSLWESPVGPVKWTKGQPMGLFPSFASFGLTHGLLLESLVEFYNQQFFILGDDVVILDAGLYDRYLTALDMLECPYDSTKSIVSNSLTEFAGRVITADSVVPQYKWRDVNSDNFMDFMRAYGQAFQRNLPRELRMLYRKVAHLLPPFGCGHSLAEARPLAEVAAETETFMEVFGGERKGRKFHVSFLRLLCRLNPHNRTSLFHRLHWRTMEKMSREFEQKTRSAFQSLPQWIEPLSEDLTDVFQFAGLTPALEAVGSGSFAARKTLASLIKEALLVLDKRPK